MFFIFLWGYRDISVCSHKCPCQPYSLEYGFIVIKEHYRPRLLSVRPLPKQSRSRRLSLSLFCSAEASPEEMFYWVSPSQQTPPNLREEQRKRNTNLSQKSHLSKKKSLKKLTSIRTAGSLLTLLARPSNSWNLWTAVELSLEIPFPLAARHVHYSLGLQTDK